MSKSRNWKFIGGPKGPRNSLKAAVSAIQEKAEGERAIFNADTGEMFDIIGGELHVMVAHQYSKVTDLLALLYVSGKLDGPVDPQLLVPMITGLGGTLSRDILVRAREMTERLTEAAQDTARSKEEDGDS